MANRDILVYEAGSYVQRYVYAEDGARLSLELSYTEGTERGEPGQNIASDIAVNDIGKVWYRRSLLDSTLFAVDKDGEIVIHMIYDPWGKPLSETNPGINFSGLDNINNYTGYTWDETLKIYYAQARFYDPETRRFTQEDPSQDDLNWFTYCLNNPLRYVDLDGRLPLEVTFDYLKKDTDALKDYIKELDGINRDMPDGVYQILYGSPLGKQPANKEDAKPLNRYGDYKFGELDALSWLIQTGGNINFILQMRDATVKENEDDTYEMSEAIEESAVWQAATIKSFIEAAEILNGLNDPEYAIDMDNLKFFIGSIDGHPQSLLSTGGKTGIYDQVERELGDNSSMIAGVYFGEEMSRDDDYLRKGLRDVALFMQDKGELLWIPYFFNDIGSFYTRVECYAEFFDTVLLQPGSYYQQDKQGEVGQQILRDIVDMINVWNSNSEKSTKMGFHMEFDMGLVTGRGDIAYVVSAREKREMIWYYLDALDKLNPGTPLGIYSGGPNEHAYSTPHKNDNRHNTGNHTVENSDGKYDHSNNKPYSDFDGHYDWNLIYDINNYLFRDRPLGKGMSERLYDFLKKEGK